MNEQPSKMAQPTIDVLEQRIRDLKEQSGYQEVPKQEASKVNDQPSTIAERQPIYIDQIEAINKTIDESKMVTNQIITLLATILGASPEPEEKDSPPPPANSALASRLTGTQQLASNLLRALVCLRDAIVM